MTDDKGRDKFGNFDAKRAAAYGAAGVAGTVAAGPGGGVAAVAAAAAADKAIGKYRESRAGQDNGSR